jgi:serine/threonine protein kinase/tetratricopeptide (TPR) repeat protein
MTVELPRDNISIDTTDISKETTLDSSSDQQAFDLVAPQRIGPYKLLRQLGEGGMGAVYLAERDDEDLHMKAAIKLVRRKLVNATSLELFREERQRLADLKHPNICVLYDAGTTADGMLYLIMEHIEGQIITDWCRPEDEHVNKPGLTQLLNCFVGLLKAVSYAHEQGVIHRDIKPGNVMVDQNGQVKLLDFGIATSAESNTYIQAFSPSYAAPEQKANIRVDHRADIYALCLTFMEMLIGIKAENWPDTHKETISQLMSTKNNFPDAFQDLPEALGYILRKGLEPARVKRYQSCADLLEDIQRVRATLNSSPIQVTSGEAETSPQHDLVLWFAEEHRQQVQTLFEPVLAQQSFKIWPNKERMAGPIQANEVLDALKQSRTCALIFGPTPQSQDAFHIPTEVREFIGYRQACQMLDVIPMLLAGTAYPQRQSELPAFLRSQSFTRLPDSSQGDATSQLDQLLRIHLQPTPPSAVEKTEQCPFRGLEPFREQDQKLFFGRDNMIQMITEHLEQRTFLAVIGPSGSGKSSLIYAGIIPQFRNSASHIVSVKPGHDPFMELSLALGKLANLPSEQIKHRLMVSPQALYFVIREILGDNDQQLVIHVDQFEELFTLTKEEQTRTHLIDKLNYLIDIADPRIKVIVSMRSDFIGRCAAYEGFNLHLQDNLIQVSPLNKREMTQAILEPCRLSGLRLEKGLLVQILSDMQGAGSELPLLEYALLELYNLRDKDTLTFLAYRQIGGLQGAVAQRAESEYAKLSPNQQSILQKIFTLCLVIPAEGTEHTRRRATWAECLAVTHEPDQAEDLLEKWLQARLLVGYEEAGSHVRIVDVAHEALIRNWQRIGDWMAANLELVRQHQALRRAANAWVEAGRHPDLLLRGVSLQRMEFLTTQEEVHLGEFEEAFLAAGIEAREAIEREKEALAQAKVEAAKRRARIIAVVATAFVLVCVVFIYNLNQTVSKLNQANSELDAANTELDQKIVEVEHQRTEANNQRDIAEAVTQFQLGMFAKANPGDKNPEDISIKELLEKAIEEAENSLEKTPEVRAKLLFSLGSIYFEFGQYVEAERLIRLAITTLPENSNEQAILKDPYYALGLALSGQGNYVEAECFLQEAIRWNRQTGEIADVALSLRQLAATLNLNGKYDQSKVALNESISLYEALDRPETRTDWASALLAWGRLMGDLGYAFLAVDFIQESFIVYENIHGDDHQHTIVALGELARMYRLTGDHDLALSLYREALARQIRTWGENHPHVGATHNNLGLLQRSRGDYDAAVFHYESALAIKEKSTGRNTPTYAISLSNLGTVYRVQKKYREARERFSQAKDIWLTQVGGGHPHSGVFMSNLADAEQLLGLANQAANTIEQALTYFSKTLNADHWRLDVARSIQGAIHADQSQHQAGEALMVKAHLALGEKLGTDSRHTRESAQRLIDYYTKTNQPNKAVKYTNQIE